MYNNYEYGSKEYYKRELDKKEETFRLMVLGFRSTENDIKFQGTDAIGMQLSRLKDAYDDYVTYKEYAESIDHLVISIKEMKEICNFIKKEISITKLNRSIQSMELAISSISCIYGLSVLVVCSIILSVYLPLFF